MALACATAPAAWAEKPPRIAYQRDYGGLPHIWVITLDGSSPRQLTFGDFPDYSPSFSPDGRRIVYEHYGVVWVMNSDGSDQHPVGWYYTYRPSWSRDGRRLTFYGNPPHGSGYAIFTSNPDGGDVKQLTTTADGQTSTMPAFSPDARRIVFERNNFLWLVNADGSGEHVLSLDLMGSAPAWSPTGSSIAFQWNGIQPPFDSVGGGNDLYTVNPDGTHLRQLTHIYGEDSAAAWSPDGRRIAFDSQRNGNRELYVMNADGSGLTRITNDGEDRDAPGDGAPSWDPSSGSGAPPPPPAAPGHRDPGRGLTARCPKRQRVGRRGLIRVRVRATPGSVVAARGRLIVTKRFEVAGAKSRVVHLRLRHRPRSPIVARIRLTARAPDGERSSAIAVTALR